MNKPSPNPSNPADDGIDLDRVQELAARAKARDEEAFGELVRMYNGRVYGLVYRMVGQADDARDLAQQTWIKAWNKIGGYKEEARFYTWLYRVAVNTAMDFLRQRKRQQEVELNDEIKPEVLPGTPQPLSTSAPPGHDLEQGEIRQAFFKALESLSPEHKAALMLREVEGRSYKEIAQVMKCRIGTVMSRIFYARKTIQQQLKELR